MWRSLVRSFGYAGRGMRLALRSHINMRVHLVLGAVVALAAVWADVSAPEAAILVLCVMAVLAAELFNTAIEVLVDLQVGRRYHELAGRAKDLAAAAVLTTAAGAVVVGVIVLGPAALRAITGGRLDHGGVASVLGLASACALAAGVAGRRSHARFAGGAASWPPVPEPHDAADAAASPDRHPPGGIS